MNTTIIILCHHINCEITDKKILSKATRNLLTQKHIANIFILDTTCLI